MYRVYCYAWRIWQTIGTTSSCCVYRPKRRRSATAGAAHDRLSPLKAVTEANARGETKTIDENRHSNGMAERHKRRGGETGGGGE